MQPEPPSSDPWSRAGTVRILIVEEQVLCSEMLREILSAQPGLRVVATARTAAAAEALLEREGVDVVLLDLLLPDRSGLELIGALAARGSRARLVVCSAMNHRAAIATAFSLGAHAFVPKTATLAELIDTLRTRRRVEIENVTVAEEDVSFRLPRQLVA